MNSSNADDPTIYFSLDEFPRENREIAINSELEKLNYFDNNSIVNQTKYTTVVCTVVCVTHSTYEIDR